MERQGECDDSHDGTDHGWLARYYAVVRARMAVRLASVRAAVHGDGEENIASFARWYPASAAQFAG